MHVITKAHMNRREADHTLLHTWFSYTEHKFVMAVFPETDDAAKQYIPQNVETQNYYNDLRDQGMSIVRAFKLTLDWVIEHGPK